MNQQQGNDQVIAKFFKKSLLIFATILAFGTIAYFLLKKTPEYQILEETEFKAPQKLKPKQTIPQVIFTEEAKKRGIDFTHVNGAQGERMLPETMGGGVAFIDIDNDGDQDLIFTNGSTWSWDKNSKTSPSSQKLFMNDGTGNFKDVSELWRFNHDFYATGIAVGDVNNDGFDDVFIAAVGKNRLYLNNQGNNFNLAKIDLDCSNSHWSSSAGFFDYDNDGDLDLMILNYIEWNRELDLAADYKIDGIGRAYGPPSNFPGTHNCLFENQLIGSNFNFSDVSSEKGLIVKSSTGDLLGKSLALVFDDLNQDGWQDVIVANDTTRNFVFLNQKGKSFKESGAEIGLAYNSSGKATGAMGVDSANYKNNQDLAVSVGNFANEMTSFYVNRSQLGFFTDESVISGIGPASRLALSFGLFFFDYDLDGRLDLFQTNGHVENDINKVQTAQNYAQKSQLFWNCGSDCERQYLETKDSGAIINEDIVGRAAAYGDIDNDGDWDVVITQVGARPKLYINQLKNKSWIGIKLNSSQPIHNAYVEIKTETQTYKRSFNPTRSYQSQVQADQIIGLGNDKIISIMIISNDKILEIQNYKTNSWNEFNL